jgi:dephospho-CoA kinase
VKIIGLTGSIAMGKSAVARILAAHDIPVLDSDEVVHAIYEDGSGARVLKQEFAGSVEGGKVNRQRLSRQVLGEPTKLRRLEELIHPLLRERQAQFLAEQERKGANAAVLAVPLLFETGNLAQFDAVIVVSAPESLQRQRALARTGMTEERLQHILDRQMPDAQKRQLATHVIENAGTIAELERETMRIMGDILSGEARR